MSQLAHVCRANRDALSLLLPRNAADRAVAVERLGPIDDLIPVDLVRKWRVRGISDFARQINDPMAAQADDLCVAAGIRIEVNRAVTGIEAPHITPGDELVERLVYRGQRETGQLREQTRMKLLGSGMRGIVLERAIDQYA